MPGLWSELWQRWLGASPGPGHGLEIGELSGHLRRDIGLAGGEDAPPPDSIRHRNLTEVRIFCSLHAYR